MISLNSNAADILNAVIVFLVIDLILRQALNRLDVTARLRIDSLSGSIRPCMRKLNRIFLSKTATREDLEQIVEYIDSIKPLPPVKIKEIADKIVQHTSYQAAYIHLDQLAIMLNKHFISEKIFVSYYSGLFSSMRLPMGISVLLAVAYYSIPLLIIPVIFYYSHGVLSVWYVVAFMLISVFYEVAMRIKIQ